MTKERKERSKGNFGIFVQVTSDDLAVAAWERVETSEELMSTQECDRYIKGHADDFAGKEVMIAQVKKVGKVRVKTTVSVDF